MSSTTALPVRATTTCALGFLIAKTSFAISLGPHPIVFAAFLTGFLGDSIVVALVALVARFLPRVAFGVACAFGLYACANVYLAVAFGSPLTAGMLAYRKDADTSVLAPAPLIASLASIAAFVVVTVVVVRMRRTLRARTLVAACAIAIVVGIVGRLVDTDGTLRSLGLDRNAVALLVTTALPDRSSSERIAWDSPWPAPHDARYTAPIVVDKTVHPKHVVIWLAESTGAKHTTVFGDKSKPATTPNLDRLRDHELRFENYDANAPVSAKAIFTTMCGFYPSPEAEFETRTNPRIACPSLMETLTRAGFDAALFHGGYFAFTDKLAFLEERGFDTMLDGESVPDRDRYWTNGWGVDDKAIVDHGVQWLDAHKDRPTLEIFIPLLPHYEYFMPPTAPLPFGTATMLAKYENGVHYSDELFGRLVDEYKARGLDEDTLFVFVGDHGEAFDEHRNNTLHAHFLYEENVHAPLVMYAPKLFAHETVSARLASHVDLAATILDLVGVDVPAKMQGQSLVADAYKYRPTFLFTSYPDPLVGLRDGDKKFVRNLQTNVDELYDLARDPGEKHNVAAAFPDVVRTYRARLADFVVRQKQFVDDHPAKGPGFLDRAFASIEARVVDENGAAVACARQKDRVVCKDGVWLGVVVERVFNMERRCLRVAAPTSGKLVVDVKTDAPLRTIGVGLTDQARFAHGSPVHATFTATNEEPVELVVNDTFETTSKARSITPSTTMTIEIAKEAEGKRENRAACLTLAP